MCSRAMRRGKCSVEMSYTVIGRLNHNTGFAFSIHSMVLIQNPFQPEITNANKSKQRFLIELDQHW